MIGSLSLLLVMQSGVKLNAATAVIAGKPEVRLRWQIPEGWIPPGGLKLYRIAGTTKTLVRAIPPPSDASVDALLGPKFKGKKLATAAATALPPGSRLNFAIIRAPSSATAFQTKKATVGKKPSAPGGIRRSTGPAAAATATPTRTGPRLQPGLGAPQIPTPLKVRSELHLAALLDESNAATIGLGATDKTVTAGATVSYALYPVVAGGQDGPQPIASLNGFVVGSDTQPSAPTGLVFLQEDEEIGIRWDRLPAATETQLLAASYRVFRADGPGAQPVRLTPKPLLIMDLEGKEPVSFFVDNLTKPGTYTYSVVLVDGFNRTSPPAILNVVAAEWRTPGPISKAFAGPGMTFSKAFKGQLRTDFRMAASAAAQPPTVRPTIAWRSASAPDRLPVKYNVYRYDLDQPNAPAVKLTTTPIDGNLIPFATDAQLEDAIDLVYGPGFLDEVDAKIAAIAGRPATTPAQISDRARDMAKAAAAMKSVRARIKAQFNAYPPRVFEDTAAQKDHKFLYSVTAHYAPLGLETEEAMAGEVGIPDPAKPAAVVISAPKFLPAPAPAPKVFAKLPLKTSRSPFISSQIKSRKSTPRTSFTKPGGTPNLRSPLMAARTPLKLNLPPSDFGGTVELSWPALPLKDVRYRVRRKLGNEPFADVGMTARRVATYRDPVPRSRVRQYEYEVAAISRWNVISLPAKIVATVPATVAPEIPNILSASVGDADGEILVKVETAQADQGVARYRFFRGAEAAGVVDAATAQAGVVTFKDTGRAPGAKLSYTVEAETAAGIRSPRSPAVSCAAIKTSVPAPTGLTGTPGPTGVVLRWTASAGAVSYVVRRKVGTGPVSVLAPKVTAVTFTDVFALKGRSYTYEVVAVDAQNNVSALASITVAVQ